VQQYPCLCIRHIWFTSRGVAKEAMCELEVPTCYLDNTGIGVPLCLAKLLSWARLLQHALSCSWFCVLFTKLPLESRKHLKNPFPLSIFFWTSQQDLWLLSRPWLVRNKFWAHFWCFAMKALLLFLVDPLIYLGVR